MDELRCSDEKQIKIEKRLQLVKEYAVVVFSTLIYTLTTYMFVVDNGFASSGFSGVLVMIEKLFDLSSGAFTLFFMNFPLLIWGWFTLSKDFAIKTTLSVFLMCLGFYVLGALGDKVSFLHFSTETVIDVTVGDSVTQVAYLDFGKKFFCSILSGVFAGVCIALCFKNNASLGGVDIIVSIIQKKRPHANVSLLLIAANALITVAGYFVFGGIESVCFALIYIFIFSKVCEFILKGFKKALKFEVITDTPDALAKEIIEKLGHSVTVTHGRGMYANTDKYVLICVIRTNQIGEFEKLLKRFPGAFAYCSSVSEIFGTFFKTDRRFFGSLKKENVAKNEKTSVKNDSENKGGQDE